MNKTVAKVLLIFEYLLYVALFAIVATGAMDSLFYPSANAGAVFLIAGICLLIFYPLFLFKFPRFLTSGRTLLLTILFATFAYQIGKAPFGLDDRYTFAHFFPIIMIVFATTGEWKLWLSAASLSIAWAGLKGFNSEAVAPYLLELGAGVGGSFVVFLFTVIRQKNYEVEYETLLKEELMKQRFAVVEEKNKSDQNRSGDEEDVSLQTDSMVTTGKELDNLIFFIDKMYSPHTVCAFVYDKVNNRFILSSAKSRSGMISKKTVIPGGKEYGVIGGLAEDAKVFRSGGVTLYSKDLGYYTGNVMVNSIIVVPILSRDHGLLGALAMDSVEKLAYREEHRDRLSRFARLAAELIVNVVMRKKQQQNAARFAMFYKSALKFTEGHLKMNEVLDSLIAYIREIDDISRVTAVAYNRESRLCQVLAVHGDTNELSNGYSFTSATGSIFYSSVVNQKVEFVSDFRKIRSRAPLYVQGEALNPNIASIMVVPFGESAAEYEVVMTVESTRPNYFTTELRHIISTIIRNGSSAYEKAYLYQKMEIQATTDGLTGLCNHRHFQDNLHQAILQSERYSRPLSLLLMDIDKFKSFNDTYGHQIGDLVLQKIAEALTQSVRSTDLPARYGGEEFVVVLPETDEENSLRMAERIRATIEATPIETERGTLSVTVSIGSATRGADAMTQEQLIQCADAAMYQSKKGGRNRVTAYLKGMEDEIDS